MTTSIYPGNITKHFCFLFMFLIISTNIHAIAQTRIIGKNEYVMHEGRWYNTINSRRGDPIDTSTIIIRMKNRGDLQLVHHPLLNNRTIARYAPMIPGGYNVIELKHSTNSFDLYNSLSRDSLFDYVEYDAFGRFCTSEPNDPLFTQQWYLNNSCYA